MADKKPAKRLRQHISSRESDLALSNKGEKNGKSPKETRGGLEKGLDGFDLGEEEDTDFTPKHEDKADPFMETINFQKNLEKVSTCSSDSLKPEDVSFTLATQTSEDRLWMVGRHCIRWWSGGASAIFSESIGTNTKDKEETRKSHILPVSVAVLTDRSVEEVLKFLYVTGCGIHKDLLSVRVLPASNYKKEEYPVNELRNLALEGLTTTHAVIVDVDFWPMAGLGNVVMMDKFREKMAADPKLLAVLPAFQLKARCNKRKYVGEKLKVFYGENGCGRRHVISKMPKGYLSLDRLIRTNEVRIFDSMNWGGHGSTDYDAWFDQEPGELRDIDCVTSNRYEPYVAIRVCGNMMPPFQEAFSGYGKNKVSWFMHLRRLGYRYAQLGGAFVTHYPHEKSDSRLEWGKKPEGVRGGKNPRLEVDEFDWWNYSRGRMDQFFVQFRKWLREEVEDISRVPICADAEDDDVKLWVNVNDTISQS